MVGIVLVLGNVPNNSAQHKSSDSCQRSLFVSWPYHLKRRAKCIETLPPPPSEGRLCVTSVPSEGLAALQSRPDAHTFTSRGEELPLLFNLPSNSSCKEQEQSSLYHCFPQQLRVLFSSQEEGTIPLGSARLLEHCIRIGAIQTMQCSKGQRKGLWVK